ncbi:hypothetical protein AUC31_15090 [Planococcus rifietoensis]|uniref:2-dehydro-3-deoxygalactonokinase n=1 Tax=Planococcus rifietoensis TaxID=200991 RepID=A0A0U2Z953_9BACL|nr:2-dehydro-3-deoxygalactonokinase [Planococcus rifietoensis]ALS76443.1 hypothetical protein AUC31_15090 [Planococcus rifietoensis]
MKVILIDSGTTNSRIRLVETVENTVLDQLKINVGVRNTAIDGNNNRLKEKLKESIEKLLMTNEISSRNISYIVASGMITSKLGVYEVPHVTGPASVNDFATDSIVIKLKEFLDIPCIFVPGMKNKVSSDSNDVVDFINEYDVMRGEEVETIGLLKQFDIQGKGFMVLPGSHTKYVVVDEQQRLESCLSTLGGETLHAIQKETILSGSLNEELIRIIEPVMLEKGYEAAKKYGLTRSFYHIRLLELFAELTESERANYYVGAVIADDLKALMQSIDQEDINWVVVGGSKPLRQVFSHLLQYMNQGWNIIEADDAQVEGSLVYGAQEVASAYFQNDELNESDYKKMGGI